MRAYGTALSILIPLKHSGITGPEILRSSRTTANKVLPHLSKCLKLAIGACREG